MHRSCLALLALPFVLGLLSRPADAQSRAERQLWRTSEHEAASLATSGLIVQDPDLSAYVTSVLGRLGPLDAPVPLRVFVVLDPEANAFALPTGQVYVHAGLLGLMESEDQLAFILGHEAVHVASRHGVERIESAREVSAMTQLLGLAAAVGLGGDFGLWGSVANLGLSLSGSLAISGYGRSQEAESDRTALAMLGPAGYDACGAVALFDRLMAFYPDRRGALAFVYADHPRLRARRDEAAEVAGDCPPAPPDTLCLARTAPVRARLVELWTRAGRYDRAVEAATHYLASDSSKAHVWAWRAEALHHSAVDGSLADHAAADAREALARDSTFAMPHRTLGQIAEARGDSAAAHAAYTAYLAASPQAPDRRFVRTRLAALTPSSAPTPP